MLRFLSIVALCIGAAVAYGLVHDQITIRVCPEYFTALHPRILPADTSLTVLALAWGVIATWWVGLILGILLGTASCLGRRPKLSPRDLWRPVAKLLVVMAAIAAISGIIGYELGVHGIIQPAPFVKMNVPPSHYNRLFADGATHLASYAVGFAGGIAVTAWAWHRRGRLQRGTAG